eukprot:CAMPEP_0174256156 /NCGR_PEP_ID=MMETSP0439-20130205/5409_1 /TAXON_ID=0 /ORGANISM="Stereomyxa ramosa, Strain Chinc5" /LENGTH=300 /DNA_ID=CAMNT_0015338641 /DNA_START=1739 /DNA_END=2641 /DNA_ORIENTATION=-
MKSATNENDSPEATYDSVSKALEAGFRHFDTAELYETTQMVGKALKDSKVTREEIFLTSKLKGLPCGDYDSVKSAANNLLSDLSVDYFDLLLIHWPGSQEVDFGAGPDNLQQTASMEYFSKNIKAAWQNMLKLKADGIAKNVGVSNFYRQHLDILLKEFESAEERPTANQIFVDLAHPETEFVDFLQSNNIQVIAYRPITFVPVYGFIEDTNEIINPVLKKTGIETPQQLALAWLSKRNIHYLCKSSDASRIKLNFEAHALASKLDDDDLAALARLPDHRMMIDMYGGCDEFAVAFSSLS